MSVREFILSDKKEYLIGRHLFFWIFWGGYFTMVRHLNPVFYMATGHFPNFFRSVAEGFFFLFPQLVIIYPLIYFILPRYVFNQKYIKAIIFGISYNFV